MKTYKLGLIHATLNSVEPILNVFKKDYKEIDTINFVDESLLREANKQGKITDELVERFASLLQRAVSAEVDAILILCSVFSPTVKEMRKRFPNIPIENVDDEMLHQAVQKGKKIGVVATVASAGTITKNTILNKANEEKKEVEVFVEISTEAFEALSNKDYKGHDSLIEEKARLLLDKYNVDVIVLAQLSIARAKNNLGDVTVPVLTSPELSAKSIVDKLAREVLIR